MIDVKEIWNNHKPTGDMIVKTKINEIKHFECFLATNHHLGNHFFILKIINGVPIPELSKYKLKSILVYSIENENTTELAIFLLDNQLKDVFSIFIQDILENISHCTTEKEAVYILLNVVSKWKKMFEKVNPEGLTLEQQKGLIGELLFFNYLLDNNVEISKAIDYWTSVEQDFQAKDFTINEIGVEIKFTTSKQPKLKISNERQLDKKPFEHLFVVLYIAKSVKSEGISLNSIIEKTRNRIQLEELLVLFNNKLLLSGYFNKDKENYNKMFTIENIEMFEINEEFPKITKESLCNGVFDVSYSIEISTIEKFKIDSDKILKIM